VTPDYLASLEARRNDGAKDNALSCSESAIDLSNTD
jgi:amidophosphoribosyltransferase